MYIAIREIQREFQKAGLKCGVEQKGNNWILQSGMSGKNGTYRFLFIKDDDDGNDVAIRVFDFVKVPPHKRAEAFEQLNSFQEKYRFVRFTLDDDGDVAVEYDFPVIYEPIGAGAVEMLLRITKILDDCYPIMMRVLWG